MLSLAGLTRLGFAIAVIPVTIHWHIYITVILDTFCCEVHLSSWQIHTICFQNDEFSDHTVFQRISLIDYKSIAQQTEFHHTLVQAPVSVS